MYIQIRLINRIIIKPEFIDEAIALFKEYSGKLIIQFCLYGAYHDNKPYVSQLVVFPNVLFTVEELQEFLVKLAPFAHQYNGYHPTTIMEAVVKVKMIQNEIIVDNLKPNEVVCYLSDQDIVMESLDTDKCTRRIPANFQN